MDDDGIGLRRYEAAWRSRTRLARRSPFSASEKSIALALQRVVELLGAIEEGRRALYQVPSGFDAECVHHQRKRCQDFGDAAAIKRRADMDDMRIARVIGLSCYPLDGRRSDQRLVLLERMQAQRGFFDGRRCYRHSCFVLPNATPNTSSRAWEVPQGG